MNGCDSGTERGQGLNLEKGCGLSISCLKSFGAVTAPFQLKARFLASKQGLLDWPLPHIVNFLLTLLQQATDSPAAPQTFFSPPTLRNFFFLKLSSNTLSFLAYLYPTYSLDVGLTSSSGDLHLFLKRLSKALDSRYRN